MSQACSATYPWSHLKTLLLSTNNMLGLHAFFCHSACYWRLTATQVSRVQRVRRQGLTASRLANN